MNENPNCRLCHAPLRQNESNRRLCAVCDEYAQHMALRSNMALEQTVGELQNVPAFLAASRRTH